MKKTLALIAICLTTSSFAQLNMDMNLKNVITLVGDNHFSDATSITVPEGKYWIITNTSLTNFYFWANLGPSGQYVSVPFYEGYRDSNNSQIGKRVFFLTEGTKVYFYEDYGFIVQIWEYLAPSNQTGTLAYEEIEDTLNKGIKLFPNPTTSKVALNSSKDYNIEIFDMVGNKVMETSGNTIDMSVLSSAMYIVKAFDKATKETESYKVVKN